MMTEKTYVLLTEKIIPSWQKTIRQYEKVSDDKKYILSLKTAMREIGDFSRGLLDTISWNSLNFLRESLIPLELQKILMCLDYYNNNDLSWYNCIEELSQMEKKIRNSKPFATRGFERHYDVLGKQIDIVRF